MEARALPSRAVPPSAGALPLAGLGDERLARMVASGSERAFVVLHRRYHQPLYRYCRSLLRHEQDAQDALQATLTAAFTALRESRRDAPLRPWLFRIAHNESINLLRRRRPQEELSETLPGREPAVEQRAEDRQRLQQLVVDLGELPERQRGALIMRELSGLSHEDIALALETTPGTAKQAIFEARKALGEFEEGRAMTCDEVCRQISEGDRRALRGRRVRAHLRGCSGCRAFAGAISTRSSDLRALAPVLPATAAAALLRQILGSSTGGGSAGGSGGLLAGAAGKATLGLAVPKLAVGVAVVAAASAGVVTVAHSSHPAGGRTVAALSRSPHSSAGRLVASGGTGASGTAVLGGAGSGRSGSGSSRGSSISVSGTAALALQQSSRGASGGAHGRRAGKSAPGHQHAGGRAQSHPASPHASAHHHAASSTPPASSHSRTAARRTGGATPLRKRSSTSGTRRSSVTSSTTLPKPLPRRRTSATTETTTSSGSVVSPG